MGRRRHQRLSEDGFWVEEFQEKKHMKYTWSTIAPTAYHLKPYYSPVPEHRDFVLQHYPHFLKSKTQPSFYLDQWHDAGNNTNKNRTLRMALNSSGTKKPLNFFVPQLLVVVVSSPRRNLDKVVMLNPSDVYSLNRDCNNHFKPQKNGETLHHQGTIPVNL